uniref:G-protein coupled receptors family 1 profile domain-containing protein n=1 Tax=Trichobilharzia regenti TaxID=157069 RepID=A0AA85IU27_TRIRE|nr:unnamed protein product [Trichobilharzia regenti]
MLKHWDKFTPPDPIYNYIIGTYVGIIGITGMIVNLLVIFVFSSPRYPTGLQNALIINLAISDFGFSAVIGFPLKTVAAFNLYWPWGVLACQLYGFASGTFGFVSLTTISAIAFDRYSVIVKNFKINRHGNFRFTIMIIIGLWVWSLLWTIPPFFGYGRYVLEGFHTSCTFDYISNDVPNLLFSGGMYIFGFMFPVLLSVYCYLNLIRVVRQNERNLSLSLSSDGRFKPYKFSRNRKRLDIQAAKSSVLLLLFYLMSWTPYATVCLVSLLGHTDCLTPMVAEIPCIFAKMAAIYDPFVYAFKNAKFKSALGIGRPSKITAYQYDTSMRKKLSQKQEMQMSGELLDQRN